jgi:hypothetical protein
VDGGGGTGDASAMDIAVAPSGILMRAIVVGLVLAVGKLLYDHITRR